MRAVAITPTPGLMCRAVGHGPSFAPNLAASRLLLLPCPGRRYEYAGLGRFSIDKTITGDLEGSTKGEMLTGGDPKQGLAGYVAIEVCTGTLAGKHGGFALQHSATMDGRGRKMSVIVVPGSGTGELKGISGDFNIEIVDGRHDYDLLYTLP